jgi:lipopolysaccharide/colanic/teichoic acid biosynthesis glycosyltransferase
MAQMIYPLDFFFRRLLPKLPGLRRVYFFLTRGRNRLLSKAEALGRLYFCGFKVIAAEEIGERLFFIAQRVKNPSLERNPSYGTLIKLKRIGLDGRTFYIRKFRTMHPYSEFLQEYLYENHKLHDTGKFKDDFRVTGWGKVFRRLWIDELPQILNYMQGDVNLVGVRALSQHYFNLYPAEMQEMRVRFKPGLIPPFYADMPQSFEDIVASERRYLELKGKAPFRTDITYFLRAVYNILFRQARSQ